MTQPVSVNNPGCGKARRSWSPCIAAVVVSLTFMVSAPAADKQWKPAGGRLLTPWAEKVSPENVHPEYPRPQMVRPHWMNLNGLWQLAIAQANDPVPTGKQLPERILVPFPVESALSGVMKPADYLWYRRTFHVPAAWKGRRVLLHFQAVDWETTVYVNGKRLGTHRGGYDSFSFDITGALRPGGAQELLVHVFDPTDDGDQPRGKQVNEPKGIWYTSTTGIWQTVWLEAVPNTYIESLSIVPDVDNRQVQVVAETAGKPADCLVRVEVPLGNGVTARAEGPPGKAVAVAFPADHQVKLWSPDSPHLYDLRVSLVSSSAHGNSPLDTVSSYFGMRKVDLGKDERGFTRIRLNGKPLFQIGPLDQGFWPDGLYTAPTDEALRYDIEVTRRLGFNAARKHVKIEPQRWYYWCDKLGLLVWQDMPNGNNRTPQSRKQFEQELTELVLEHRNHPSIIMWVVFNEGWGQHDTPRYVQLVRRLDPTRLVNNASGWTDEKVGHVHDIHRYPGPAAPEPESDRAGVLGEFGGLGLAVPEHTWSKTSWGYRGMADREELSRHYVSLLRRVWQLHETRGLSAAIYTQTTDVEIECNGLMTYDRRIIKPNVEAIAAANAGRVPKLVVVVPTSQQKPVVWKYTLQKPPGNWFATDYDDSSWKNAPGGFGRKGTPGAVVRTPWTGSDIWLRRQFVLPEVDFEQLVLLVHHDEDAEIYLNGVLAAKVEKFSTDYEELAIRPAARRALKAGKNTMAIHCRQTTGGQYIDAGIVRLVPVER